MSARARALVALLALAAVAPGCRKDAPRVAPPRTDAPIEGGDEVEDPRTALTGAMLELYGHLSLGNTGAYVDALAPGDPVALFGVTPNGVVIGRSKNASRDRRIFRAMGPLLLAKNLDVALAEDESVGWIYDEMSYRVTFEERIASIPIRQTSVWIRDFDRWVEVQEHWSYAMPVEELLRLAAADELPAPSPFKSFQDVPPAREILRLLGRLHNASGADRAAMLAADESRLIVVLPDQEHRGAAARTAPSIAQLFGDAATVGLRSHRLAVAKNGRHAWVAANLVVRALVNGDAVDVGLRGTYVLEREPGGWRVVQLHISAPLTVDELARRVFGPDPD